MDTFDPALFGGTGRTGDWPKFRRHRERNPERTWILSGGLNPGNVGEALAGSGARFVDVNSGVESAPGVKDHARLKAFIVAVHKAAAG
jgi:phosphoribosylanthranilate isomerase